MIDIKVPFSSNIYKNFTWDNEYISYKVYSNKHQVAVFNGFALASEYQLTHPDLCFVTETGSPLGGKAHVKTYRTNELLKRNNLVLCEFPEAVTEITETAKLGAQLLWQQEIVYCQLEWIKHWTHVLLDHAAQRKIGEVPLLSIPSIRLRLARSIQHYTLLKQCVAQDNWSTQQAMTDIESMVDSLIKTAGGRSMLQHGLVEMIVLFSLMNHVYLGKVHARI